jgi:CBS domain-containing protein
MVTVKQLLKEKSVQVWAIAPEVTVYDALKMMSDKNVGALPVVEAGKLVGVISERDYARKVVLQGKSSLQTPVRDIMTSKVICVRPDQKMSECMALMTDKRVRHLPVLDDNGKLVGIISIGDVLKEIIAEQRGFIQDLTNYIEGRGYGQ